MSEETTNSLDRPEELTDILLVLDKEKKKIQAVKSLDEKGNMETVAPIKKNLGDFMQVDRSGNIFSNFFKNFFSELKNPTNFSFFKVPSPISMDVAKELQKQVKNPTPEGEKVMQQYEIKTETPKEQVKTEIPKEQEKIEAVPPAPQQEAPKQQEQVESTSQTPQSASPKQDFKYKVEDIDWDTMNNLGLSKEYLEQKKMLEPLLKGYKSNVLVPVSLNLGGAIVRTDARIWLQPGNEGKVVAALQGVRKEPNLKFKFFGHEFTDEDKKNLLETGNMGRVVHLTNPKTGEIIPSIVSLDKLTNELVALRTTKMTIPDEMKGVKLNDQQKQTLMEGKPLLIEGMISKKNTEFSANVQYNADKRYVEFLYNKDDVKQQAKAVVADGQQVDGIPTVFRKQELTEEQRAKLANDQPAFISLIDKQGKPYQGYITYNKETKKTDFLWPDDVKLKALPVESNKTQVAVNSDGKTNESTKNINEPLDSKQGAPKNEQQQQQQHADRAPKKNNGPKL